MAKKIRLTDHASLSDGLPKHNIRKQINQEKIQKIEKAIDGDFPTSKPDISTKAVVEKKIVQEKTIVPEKKTPPTSISKKPEVIKTKPPIAEKKIVTKPKRKRGRPKADEEGQLTTLRFPSELYIELKIKAFREKKTFRELIMEGLEYYLKHKK